MLVLAVLCGWTTVFADGPPQRILFIGNSYTASHDLPGIFRRIVASTGRGAPHVASHAPGGRPLAAQAKDPACTRLIAAGGWDVVVLQGQSQEAAFAEVSPEIRAEFLVGGRDLARLVRDASPAARIVLFQTWARHPGFWRQSAGVPAVGRDAADMLARTRKWYSVLAEAERCEVAPVGEAWLACGTEADPVPLHSADHSHPQYAGSYLAAVVLYGTIYRPERLEVPFRGALDDATAERLQKVAARALDTTTKPRNAGGQ
jgi:hypothetical protein